MPAWKLAVGSGEFWELARADIAAAKHRVLIQAMTWEGDAAGLPVAHAIGGSSAADRRVPASSMIPPAAMLRSILRRPIQMSSILPLPLETSLRNRPAGDKRVHRSGGRFMP